MSDVPQMGGPVAIHEEVQLPDPYKDNRNAAEGVGDAIEGAFGKLGDALDAARGRPAPPPAPPADEHHGGDVNITINQ